MGAILHRQQLRRQFGLVTVTNAEQVDVGPQLPGGGCVCASGYGRGVGGGHGMVTRPHQTGTYSVCRYATSMVIL